ncbi:bifunctional diguanylate cyclase/phosphodiesterase [Sphingomonas sp. So64.6b]|uniref:putative bifunctional diguanylate cyclase/phosphodiesterase n=1 Tax=Sphingomonas sp. So64.6b TaxID=2997354 RepID=UPI0031F67C5F
MCAILSMTMPDRRVRPVFGDHAQKPFRAIAVSAMLLLVGMAGLAFAGIYWSTHQSDQISVARQLRVAQLAIDVSLDELALQQETVAIWDDAATKLADPHPPQTWLYDNIGSWLHRIFKHDEVFILDSSDRPIQSVSQGRLVSNRRFMAVRKDLLIIIDGARGRRDVPNGRHDRNIARPLHEHTTVRTTARATHDTHLMLVDGRPAAASAMMIKPSTPGYVRQPNGSPLLVSVRYLDGNFLADLSARHLIDAPRFSRVDNARDGEQSLLLRTEWRQNFGYLIWHPELPGTKILHTLIPLNAFVLLALGAFISALAFRLSKSMHSLATTQTEASYRSFHDPLTGLPNRSLLKLRIDKALAACTPHQPIWLMMIDIDRFKEVNDTLGHLAGDQLIRKFADRLVALLPPGNVVARLGGDEFAVLLAENWTASTVRSFCDDVRGLFDRPFDLAESQVFASASVGTARAAGGVDEVELMRRADVALYRAKDDGRNCARPYASVMDAKTRRRSILNSELRRALEEGELAVWYQPEHAASGGVVGFEALLRWHHPVHGLLTPGEIIPVAEETGLIGPIGDFVIHEVARTAAQWPQAFFAVNLSPVQFRTEGFADRLLSVFLDAGADPRRIELEVTERVLLDDSPAIHRTLLRLRGAGFRIALDDFGTGYSSLGYLQRFRVDKIKIDQSFVARMEDSAGTRAIVGAIIALGHALDLTVTAEGVETSRQADILVAAGCDELQGYFFSAAQPMIDLARPALSHFAA